MIVPERQSLGLEGWTVFLDEFSMVSINFSLLFKGWIFPVAQTVKNLPAMWETQVRSLGQEDPLEKGMATHFSILAWRIPLTEEPVGLRDQELNKTE